MKTSCPHCRQISDVSKDLAGKVFICPECKNLFPIPSSDAMAAEGSERNRVCPNCGWLLEPGEILCVKCGFNFATREVLTTETDPKSVELAPLPLRVISWAADLAPGLFKPFHLLLFIITLFTSLFLAWMSLVVLALGGIFSCVAVGAGAMMVYAQGVAWLFCDSLLPLKAAMVELEGDQWTAFLCVVFAPFLTLLMFIFCVGKYVRQ